MTTIGSLYKISFPSNKSYIGITKRSVEVRWYEHCKSARLGSSFAVHKAIRKYGADNIKIETLVIGEWSYLAHLESRAIDIFKTKGSKGYNLTTGGEGNPGATISDATRLKLSLSHRGKRKPLSEETKRKISSTNLGQKRTPEQNAENSERQKGKKMTAENLAKLVIANTGRRRTDEEKAIISASHLGKPLSIEHRAKLSAAKKGKPVNRACAEASIKACTGRKLDPELVARRWEIRRRNKLEREASCATMTHVVSYC